MVKFKVGDIIQHKLYKSQFYISENNKTYLSLMAIKIRNLNCRLKYNQQKEYILITSIFREEDNDSRRI